MAIPMAIALLALAAAPGAAQEPMQTSEPADPVTLADPQAAALDARAAEIAAKLRCPVCTGQSVLESNSDIAQEMQAVIRERLERGATEAEILDYFVGAYGDWIILKPRATGVNLLVYVLPAAVLLAGGVWLFIVLRRWSARDEAPRTPESLGLSAEDEAWLRQSLDGK